MQKEIPAIFELRGKFFDIFQEYSNLVTDQALEHFLITPKTEREFCPICHCQQLQIAVSVLHPFHKFWSGPRRYLKNYYNLPPEYLQFN